MDDDEESPDTELTKVVNLLITLRTRKIDKLNAEYRKAQEEHALSILETKNSEISFSNTIQENVNKKNKMQTQIFEGSTDIRKISAWLNKEKNLDNIADDKKRAVLKAKNLENDKSAICSERKKSYVVAEKRLEKMKLFKEALNGN